MCQYEIGTPLEVECAINGSMKQSSRNLLKIQPGKTGGNGRFYRKRQKAARHNRTQEKEGKTPKKHNNRTS